MVVLRLVNLGSIGIWGYTDLGCGGLSVKGRLFSTICDLCTMKGKHAGGTSTHMVPLGGKIVFQLKESRE